MWMRSRWPRPITGTGLVTVLACQAGKDVYVEKPISHNIAEGRAMVQAARKHNRLVFAGTQQRSAPHFAELATMVQGGGIGKVHLVRVWNFSNMLPNGIGRAPDSDPPNGLDWDMYLGPAPKVPYNPKAVPKHLPLVLGLCGRNNHRLRHAQIRHRSSDHGRRQARERVRNRGAIRVARCR